ncbi:MAG: hypothetical protein PVH61_43430 [Candidatus Aminicenantes bacterium]|jgi:hypothetical protein
MKPKRNYLFIIFLIIITLTIMQNFTFAYIFANGSGGGYGGGGGDEGAGNSSINIEMLVVEGAGYYLHAQTDIMSFLHRVEMSGNYNVNVFELNTLLQRALDNLVMAAATYDLLIRTAEVTPYNETVIMKLKVFPYDQYLLEQGMNPSIFKEVAAYLGQGNITGMYRQIRANLEDIIEILRLLKEDVSSYKLPPLTRVWQLNEMCFHTLIFGQYAARVFAAL